jgi:hypothetical protein
MAPARMVCCLLAASAACHKAPTCEQVWDHIVSLAPDEMRAAFASKREREVAACERELSDDDKRCAMSAHDLDELSRCRAATSEPAGATRPPRSRDNDGNDVRDVVVRFGADAELRGTPVELVGYAVSITNDIPFTKHGVRIYPVTISDHADLDAHSVNVSCVSTSPVSGIAEGDRVRVTGRLAGDPMADPEVAQVQLDDCTIAPEAHGSTR